MKFILKRTNSYGETWFFQNLGNAWPGNPSLRLIERTTSRQADARRFDTAEQATETWATAGKPPGWEVVEVAE